ncbi:MAG: hypothetical protein M1839_004580 [Geoglossum umbratile]|nr:MAG: hypothetical protein M1839_004580 [Geoglossum umbratile]
MVNNRKGLKTLSAALLLVSSNIASAAPTRVPRAVAGDKLCGPTSFCPSLTPGEPCIPIAAGCCITVPSDKNTPTPVCGTPEEVSTQVAKRQDPAGQGLDTNSQQAIFEAILAEAVKDVPGQQKRFAEPSFADLIAAARKAGPRPPFGVGKRRISGSSLFDTFKSVAEAGVLAGQVIKAATAPPAPQKRSDETPNLDDINSLLDQAELEPHDEEKRKISGSALFDTFKSVAEAGVLAGQVIKAATQKRSDEPSLLSEINYINSLVSSHAADPAVEARKISGSSILNSVKNVAEIASLAGQAAQLAGILPSKEKRALQDDIDNINNFLQEQAANPGVEARKISGSSILSSVKNVAEIASLAGQAAQLAGILPSKEKRALQDDIDNINNFLQEQAANPGVEARKISGSSILSSVKNVAEIASLAGQAAQLAGILPSKEKRSIFKLSALRPGLNPALAKFLPIGKRSAEPSLQDDIDNISNFLSESGVQTRDEEEKRSAEPSVQDDIDNIRNYLSESGVQARDEEEKRSAEPSVQDDIDNIKSFLSESGVQARDEEKRKIGGLSILNSIKNVAEIASLAGQAGQLAGILPSKEKRAVISSVINPDAPKLADKIPIVNSAPNFANRIPVLNDAPKIANKIPITSPIQQRDAEPSVFDDAIRRIISQIRPPVAPRDVDQIQQRDAEPSVFDDAIRRIISQIRPPVAPRDAGIVDQIQQRDPEPSLADVFRKIITPTTRLGGRDAEALGPIGPQFGFGGGPFGRPIRPGLSPLSPISAREPTPEEDEEAQALVEFQNALKEMQQQLGQGTAAVANTN